MPLIANVGGGGELQSRNIGADTLINLYYESQTLANSPKRAYLTRTPGLALWAVAGDVSCRGCFQQDGRGFAVIGATLYELDLINNGLTSRGTVANDGLPVFFSSNGQGGNQLAIAGGGQLKVFNLVTNTLSAAIVLPLTNAPGSLLFIDSYFVLAEKNTLRVWWSALADGTSWNAIDFFARSQVSDNVVGLLMLHNRILVYGSQTSQVYYDSGDSLNPFLPYPGTLTQEGAVSPYAMIVMGESSFWLSQDNQGQRRIVSASDYAPERISTPAIDNALAGYSSVNDCETLAYELIGHQMVRFTFPKAGIAWEYDVREQLWHQCAHWDQQHGTFDRPRPRGQCSSDQGLIVGDYENACLYYLSPTAYTDNGDLIRWARRAPYLSAENQWIFIDEIEQGIESGVGLDGDETNPQIQLSISRNSGHSWEAPLSAGMGRSGDYNARALWRRLGRVRADRLVVEESGTAPVKTILGPGMFVRATPGTGQL